MNAMGKRPRCLLRLRFDRFAVGRYGWNERPLAEVSIFDLINAFQKVLKKVAARREDLREIFEENFTVSDKIEYLLQLTSERPSGLKFTDLFATTSSRSEVVVTFLALLELIRLKQIRVLQAEPFGEIELVRVV